MGYYGMRVHEAVYARGVKYTGATVHFVDEGADTGAIIKQVVVEVDQDDTPDMIQQKVLKEEHILLPILVRFLIFQTIPFSNPKTSFSLFQDPSPYQAIVRWF